MSWEPISKSLGSVIDERLSSPLVSSFAISWSIINWKFFVILFSDTTVSQTFAMVNELYNKSANDLFGWAFAAPFAASLVYIFWLPKLSQPIFRQWRITQQGTENIRNEFPLANMLSQEQSWEIEKKQIELDGLLNQERTLTRTLRGDLHLANAKLEELESFKTKAEVALKSLEDMQTKLHEISSDFDKKDLELQKLTQQYRRSNKQLDLLEKLLDKTGLDAKPLMYEVAVLSMKNSNQDEINYDIENLVKLISKQDTSPYSDIRANSMTVTEGGFSSSLVLPILRSINNGISDEEILLRLGFDSKENIALLLNNLVKESFVAATKDTSGRHFSITQEGSSYLNKPPQYSNNELLPINEANIKTVISQLKPLTTTQESKIRKMPNELLLSAIQRFFSLPQNIRASHIRLVEAISGEMWTDASEVRDQISKLDKKAEFELVLKPLLDDFIIESHPSAQGYRLGNKGMKVQAMIIQLDKQFTETI